jgi:hypothetical protein
MADYPISKEAVVRELLNLRDRLGGPFAKEVLDMALARLEGFPQMDAVPVVRCRECIHRHSSEFCECRPEDAFCSDGEKMGGGAEE